MITLRNPICRRFAWVGIAAALLWSIPFASAAEERKQFQVSEKVSEALQKMKGLQDAKDYAGMLALVDGQLKNVPPTGYDAAYLLDMKARILLQMEQYNKAIEPWEEAFKLADQHGYFEERQMLETSKLLAQLIFMRAQDIKNKPQQLQEIERAATYLRRYMDKTKKMEPDVQTTYAQMLYYQATADEKNINMALLDEALRATQQGMLGAIRPREQFYRLMLVILQQKDETARSAEVMELLLNQYPNSKDIWPMLFSTYVNLANSATGKDQRNYFVRAINTLERAQKLGFMNTQRDNYNMFTLYANAGEINLATQILHEGMRSGKIESTPTNWRHLGQFYQQANKELQAINALQEAAKLFPEDGSLETLIAQIYLQMDRNKEARDHLLRAIEKGNLGDRPHTVYTMLAYVQFELEEYDAALKSIAAAEKLPGAANDSQLKQLKNGITQTIQDLEAQKEAREQAAKKL